MWIGDGWDQTVVPAGNSASRIAPGNDAAAFTNAANSLGSTNTGLILPFSSGGAYTFAWSTGDTTEDISGLSIGAYSVTVTDCNGCTVSVSDSIRISAMPGCTDPLASNYNALANLDDGSCLYPGCTDSLATNFDPTANISDSSCTYSCAYYGLQEIQVVVTAGSYPGEISWNITLSLIHI